VSALKPQLHYSGLELVLLELHYHSTRSLLVCVFGSGILPAPLRPATAPTPSILVGGLKIFGQRLIGLPRWLFRRNGILVSSGTATNCSGGRRKFGLKAIWKQ
jgi:hypothetical protein